MIERPTTDLWIFYHKAIETPARVLCTLEPFAHFDYLANIQKVLLAPALKLRYEMNIWDKLWHETERWTFVETRSAGSSGLVDLEGTLLQRLKEHDPNRVEVAEYVAV